MNLGVFVHVLVYQFLYRNQQIQCLKSPAFCCEGSQLLPFPQPITRCLSLHTITAEPTVRYVSSGCLVRGNRAHKEDLSCTPGPIGVNRDCVGDHMIPSCSRSWLFLSPLSSPPRSLYLTPESKVTPTPVTLTTSCFIFLLGNIDT